MSGRELRTHAYQGQDAFVVEALDGLRGGFFLDSGASDGRKGSNTWLLERDFGWSGICVEPNDDAFARLVGHRECLCLNCCLYDRDGPVEFLEAAGVLGGITAEYDPEHLRYTRRTLAAAWPESEPVPTVSKPAFTLRSILERTGAPRTIDYWSLDTEGSELAILRSFPFDAYRFRVLTVEHNNGPSREPIHAFLRAHGYARVRTLGIDDAYLWVGDAPARGWQSRAWHAGRGFA